MGKSAWGCSAACCSVRKILNAGLGSCSPGYYLVLLSFLCSAGDPTQGLEHARQTFYTELYPACLLVLTVLVTYWFRASGHSLSI